MKFGNHVLRRIENVRVGDRVCFEATSANYVVEAAETTAIGMIRHTHHDGTASSSYWPGEVVYVEDADAK